MGSTMLALLLSLGGTPHAPPVAGAPCVLSRPEYGPRFVLPLELAQGATVGAGSPAPYAASVRFHPTYVLDRRRQIRLAATVGPALANPDLELLLGGRITKSVFELNAGPLHGIGAHLGLEGLYGTSGRALVGAVLIGDVGGVFQVTVRVEPDVTNGATLLELGLGTHVYNGQTPVKAAGGPPPPSNTYPGRVQDQMAFDTRAVIGEVRFESLDACERFLQTARAFVGHRDRGITTIEEFRQALAVQLPRLNAEMTAPELPPAGTSESVTVDALYRGLVDGLSPPGER